jgi:hypothetical protein
MLKWRMTSLTTNFFKVSETNTFKCTTHMHPTQINFFLQFYHGVSADRLGNIHFRTVDLGTGDGMMDKCLPVHVMNMVTKDISSDNNFVCNIHPLFTLQEDNIHCKECDVDKCWDGQAALASLTSLQK